MICPHCHKDTDDVSEIANVANIPANVQWFDAFWAAYPRKVAKASALKAWKKACTGEAIKDEIMRVLKEQLPALYERSGKDRQFIPHAATWLNGRRWEDEASLVSLSKNDKPRVIACELCGDSGLLWDARLEHQGRTPRFVRCSCARGQLPGLLIPQWAQDSF